MLDTFRMQATIDAEPLVATPTPLPTTPGPSPTPLPPTDTPEPTNTPLPTPTPWFFFDGENDDISQWSFYGGDAKPIDESLVLVGNPIAIALTGSREWNNYALEARVKLLEGDDFGLLVGATEECNYYIVQYWRGEWQIRAHMMVLAVQLVHHSLKK